MLLSDFRACRLLSIPTPSIMALTEFFHDDAVTNVHPLPVSWYFISSLLWWYLCSCTHSMPMLWSIEDAVSSGRWPILFKDITVSFAICIVLLYLSSFCLCLRSVADFSKTGAKVTTSAEHISFLPALRVMQFWHVVSVRVMIIFRWLYLYLINRSHNRIYIIIIILSHC